MVNSCNWLTARVTRVATRSTSARGTVNVEVATGYCQVNVGPPVPGQREMVSWAHEILRGCLLLTPSFPG